MLVIGCVLAVAVVCAAAWYVAVRDSVEDAAGLLAYEPIDLQSGPATNGRTTFLSPRMGRQNVLVTAKVTTAAGDPAGCVVAVHGMNGTGERMAVIAGPLAERGWTTIAPDMAWGPNFERVLSDARKFGTDIDDVMRDELIGIRRSVDWLEQYGSCGGHIVYVGVSMGGMAGVVVTAADNRFAGAVFVVAGGEYAPAFEALAGDLGAAAAGIDLSRWDPTQYADQIDADTVAVNAHDDKIITPENAQMLWDEFAGAATTVWVDGGHVPGPAGLATIVEQIDALLGRVG